LFFATSFLGTLGCTKEPPVAPASESTEGPVLPAPQRPTDAVPEATDPTTLPTEGQPAGETKPAATPPADTGAQVQPSTDGEPAGTLELPGSASAPAPADTAEAAKIEANLASFTPEDRELALKQKICPVGGGLLGVKGAPKKVTVTGHTVFICCEGCEKPLMDDPAQYLAKIGIKPADDTAVQ